MSNLKETNKNNKSKLVNLFRILDKLKVNDLTANHASIMSVNENGFYINMHNHLFSQVTPNNLVYVDLKDDYSKKYSKVNKAGFFIHKYLHNSKCNPKAILHTHSINSVAISSIKEGFNEKLNQSSMRFFKRIVYENYYGMVMNDEIAKKLAKKLSKNTKIIILKNHGSIIMGNTNEELFHLTFHFEKCCEIQLKTKNKKINVVSDHIAQLTCNQHEGFGRVGKMSWNASLRMLKK